MLRDVVRAEGGAEAPAAEMLGVKIDTSEPGDAEWEAERERSRRRDEAVARIARLHAVAARLEQLSDEMDALGDAFAARVGALERGEKSQANDALTAAREAASAIMERGGRIASMETAVLAAPIADNLGALKRQWTLEFAARVDEDTQCWDTVLVERG